MITLPRLVAVLACILWGLGSAQSSPTYGDPRELIQFSVPDGWVVKSKSNGVRFVRADAPRERTVLMVKARPADPSRSLETQRTTRLSQAGQQGFEIVTDEVRTMNGFSAWESVIRKGSKPSHPTMHTFYLFSKDVEVEVKLMAAASVYPRYRSDLRDVARSVRPD